MENTQNQPQNQPGRTSVEAEGATPTEAIKKALAILGLTKKEVKVNILSEEKKGLFGMEGTRLAKVRVTRIKEEKKA